MANETKSAGQKSSMAPFVIIGLIALVTIVGIYAVSKSGKNEESNTNTNTTAAAQSEADKKAQEAYAKAPAGATPANFLGSENSPVVVEEFADFQCPTCGVVHPKVKEVVSHFGSKIKFVFRNYPLTQLHPHAYDAAVASEAAGLQGKFWQMQEMIFTNQATWSAQSNARNIFKEYAGKIGLNVAQYETDTLGLSAKQRVDSDMQRGNAIGIQSTPTILINGKVVPFSQVEIASLKALIEAELKKYDSNAAKDGSAETKDADKK